MPVREKRKRHKTKDIKEKKNMLKEIVYTCDHIHITAVKQLNRIQNKSFCFVSTVYFVSTNIFRHTHSIYFLNIYI